MNNEKKEKPANAKRKTQTGTKSKLPAGTPSSAQKEEGLGIDKTLDPPVPNRAHTEM